MVVKRIRGMRFPDVMTPPVLVKPRSDGEGARLSVRLLLDIAERQRHGPRGAEAEATRPRTTLRHRQSAIRQRFRLLMPQSRCPAEMHHGPFAVVPRDDTKRIIRASMIAFTRIFEQRPRKLRVGSPATAVQQHLSRRDHGLDYTLASSPEVIAPRQHVVGRRADAVVHANAHIIPRLGPILVD